LINLTKLCDKIEKNGTEPPTLMIIMIFHQIQQKNKIMVAATKHI